MSRIVRFMLITTLAVLAVAPLNAQTPTPFEAWHSDLSRVVDWHLEQARQEAGHPAEAAQPNFAAAGTKAMPSENILARIAPARIAAAQRRLLALGVDAALIFAEEGVPSGLILVAAVESSYDPLALSPKGARGLWQLMPETARRFGLRVDGQTDDRIHPVRSTHAAARYLRQLYLQFGDWTLTLAAYNAGEQAVERAIDQAGSNDFLVLSAKKLLPAETRSYIPAVLAAAQLLTGASLSPNFQFVRRESTQPQVLYAAMSAED